MHKNQIVILLSIAILAFSCKKDVPLTSCIELSTASISKGESIDFTSCSVSEWSYQWTIIGPDSAVENTKGWSDKIFTNTFLIEGDYQVKLKTFSDFSFLGESQSDSVSFTVK